MNCLECRRLTLINPADGNPARLDHLTRCANCARFSEQFSAQDELIRDAAKIEVPEGFSARILLNQSLQNEQQPRLFKPWAAIALAASVLVAVLIYPIAVSPPVADRAPPALAATSTPIAPELIRHMEKHDVMPAAKHPHTGDQEMVRRVLAASGTNMPAYSQNIVYASTCVVDGHVMAHLLLQHENNHFVVFVMPTDVIDEAAFSLAAWHGQLRQIDQRSIAVLSKDASTLPAAIKQFSQQFSQPLLASLAL